MIRTLLLAIATLCLACPGWAVDKPVKLLMLKTADTSLVRQFFGRVVARQTVDLAFQVSGQIEDLPAIEGQTIAEGGLIAQLDQETFRLSLDQAMLQLDQANRTMERLERLSGTTVSQVTRDDAATQKGLAEIAVRNANYALEHATLFAPFDALVATRNVANYTTINAGQPIVRLHDMSELRIEIDVPEVLFQQAGTDPDVTITAQFPSSDQVFPLEVREFNAETSSVGQTFTLTFGMSPPAGMRILPGSSVTVTARLRQGGSALNVPAAALIGGADNSTSVMLFEPAGAETGTVRKVSVTVAPDATGAFRILDGIEPGAEIVAAGPAALEDGQTVRRFAGFAN